MVPTKVKGEAASRRSTIEWGSRSTQRTGVVGPNFTEVDGPSSMKWCSSLTSCSGRRALD
jgi:hypothetical protein